MEPSTLTDRLRSIVGGSPRVRTPSATPPPPAFRHEAVSDALGGVWFSSDTGPCFVVERRMAGDTRLGGTTVGAVASILEGALAHASLFTRGAPAAPLVFFDLETTGLSGGAGTYAFIVGCGRFEPGGAFLTRQYLLVRYDHERSMLEAVGRELADAGALVSFNGKSFDAPVLEGRCLFHRLPWTADRIPHLDV